MNTITLFTTSVSDSQFIYSVEILKRMEKSCIIKDERGNEKRVKIHKSYNGSFYIMPFGNFLGTPIFTLP
jgi:hypothetical protein